MPKPEKVRSSGAALLADGIQIKRVQSLSADVSLTRDSIQELTNAGVVSYVDQSPSVSVTVDCNAWGSVDNLALLSGTRISKTTGTDGNPIASTYHDPRRGYYSQYLKPAWVNKSSITQQSMLDGYTTLVVPILEDQSSTTVARTMIIPRATLTGYSLNFDVGGVATENFTLQSNDKVWYLNNWRDVRVFKLTNRHIGHSATATLLWRMGAANNQNPVGAATSQVFSFLATALGASIYPLANTYINGYDQNIAPIGLIVNEKFYHSTPSGAPTQYCYYFSTSRNANGSFAMGVKTLPPGQSTPFAKEGDDVWLVFNPKQNQTWSYVSSSNPGYALVSTPGSFGGVNKAYIDAYLFNTQGPANQTSTTSGTNFVGRTLRLQTIGWDLAFTTDNLDELGSYQSYGIVKQTPVQVTVTVTANDSDLQAFSKLAATSYAVTNEVYTSQFTGRNAVHVNVFKDKSKTILLQQISSTGMSVTGDAFSISVGGIASQEFTFTCDNFKTIGTGNVP